MRSFLAHRKLAPFVLPALTIFGVQHAFAFEPIGISGRTQDVIRAPSGTLHIIWSTGMPQNADIHFGELDINAPQVVGQQLVSDGVNVSFGRPLLAVSPDGNHLRTVWNRDIPNTNHGRIELAARTGSSWDITTVLEKGDPWHFTQPSVAVRNNGFAHVAFQQWPTEGTGEYTVCTHQNPDGSFTSPVQVSGNGGRDVAMAVDQHGGLHLRYSRGYRYAPAGTNLEDVADMPMPKVPTSTGGPFFGDIFVDDDTVHLVFDDCVDCTAEGTHAIGHTTIGVGASDFAQPTQASADVFPGEDPWPAVGVDPSGTVFVMWCPSTTSTSECKASIRTPGGSWIEHTLDGNAGMARVNKPTVLVTDSAVYGFWRTGNGDIVMENLSALVPVPDAGAADAPLDVASHDATPDSSGTSDGSIVAPGDGGQDGSIVAPNDGGQDAETDGAQGSGPQTSTSESDDGCACSTRPARKSPPWAWVLLPLAWLLRVRR